MPPCSPNNADGAAPPYRGKTMTNILDEREFAARAAQAFALDPRRMAFTDGTVEPGMYLALRHKGNVLIVKLDAEHQPTVYDLIIKEKKHV
jgi:hypothetical protein